MTLIDLEEKEDMFWGINDPRVKYVFPAEFSIWGYRDIFKKENVLTVEFAQVSPSAQNIVNAIKLAKESKLHSAIAVLETGGFNGEESWYVLNKGLPQALLTKINTPFYNQPVYTKEHAIVEYRQDYNLGKALLDLTLKNGHSSLTLREGSKPNPSIILT